MKEVIHAEIYRAKKLVEQTETYMASQYQSFGLGNRV